MNKIAFEYNNETLTISGSGVLENAIPYEYKDASIVIIKDGIEEIANDTFKGWYYLKTVKLPSTLKCIGKYAFAQSSLEEVTVCNGLVRVGIGAFSKTKIKEISFPDTVIEIGAECFWSCEELQSIKFPSNLEVIPCDVCHYCKNLTDVILPANLKTIKTGAFSECRYVTLDCRDNVLIQPKVFGEPSIWGCEMPPERIKHVHFTIIEGEKSLCFKTYSESEEESFATEASKWRYDTSSTQTHETWYEEDERTSNCFEEIKPKEYIIQDGKLVGVCLIGGTITSSVWGTDRKLSLQHLYFDKRNGIKKVTYDVYAGNDDWSRGEHKVWKLSYKKV